MPIHVHNYEALWRVLEVFADNVPNEHIQRLSIAISTKRIADTLDRIALTLNQILTDMPVAGKGEL